jgi:hypothetical protein
MKAFQETISIETKVGNKRKWTVIASKECEAYHCAAEMSGPSTSMPSELLLAKMEQHIETNLLS